MQPSFKLMDRRVKPGDDHARVITGPARSAETR
jgi:hypothetical protein